MALRGDNLLKPSVPAMGVIGVDPGVTSGYGLLCVHGLSLPTVLECGRVVGEGAGIAQVLEDLQQAAQQAGLSELVLVTEAQFVKDSKNMDLAKRRGQQRAALSVATSKGRWFGLAEASGIAIVEAVHPTTWREAMLGRGWGSKPRAQAKKQAVAVANTMWGLGLRKSEDHTAEALLLGAYAAKELMLRKMGLSDD